MSKKTFTIFILVLVALIAFFWWFLFFRTNTPAQTGTNATSTTNLFPFGTNGSPSGTTSQGGTSSTGSTTIDLSTQGSKARLPRLRQISFVPTAGAVVYDATTTPSSGKATSTINIRYMERSTGHIYQTESQSSDVTRVSNVTLPKVHEALWNTDGSKLLIRYTKDGSDVIRTFFAKISSTSPETALEGFFLPDGIANISVQGDKIFYLSETGASAQGILANIDGTKKVAVFNSTFGDWGEAWSTPSIVTLFPRPSGAVTGSAYTLDTTTGKYLKVAGDTLGITAITSTDGKYLLYSGANGQNSLGTAVVDIKNESSKNINISTLTDKCIWSKKQKEIVYCAVPQSIPAGIYPDDWYKGKTSFNDAIWQINVATGETTNLFTPELETGVSMDIMNPSLDQNEHVILFTNKKDMTVWRYELVL